MDTLSLEEAIPLAHLTSTPQTSTSSPPLSPNAPPSIPDLSDSLIPLEGSEALHPFTESRRLSSHDVRADPILSKMAKQQGLMPLTPPTVSAFKAKPAPTGMRDKAVGPRMSKAAALRMGVEWEGKKVGGEGGRRPVDFANTPGHKRNNLSTDIASLSRPSVAPRQNRTSQLRSGESGPAASPIIRLTPEEARAAAKVKADDEKVKRRQSIALPASLSAPSIAPRKDRTSMLRTGGGVAGGSGGKLPPTSFDRYLTSTTTANVPPTPKTPTAITAGGDKKAEDKAERRKSMIGTIRSLAAPRIAPRLNKTALLRTPQSATTSTTPGLPFGRSTAPPKQTSRPSTAHATYRPPSVSLTRTTSIRTTTTPISSNIKAGPPISGTGVGPKPTKASLLRAKLGSKVQQGK